MIAELLGILEEVGVTWCVMPTSSSIRLPLLERGDGLVAMEEAIEDGDGGEEVVAEGELQVLSSLGRVVTGEFRHSQAETFDLYLGGEEEPIRVTALHPFWSESKHQWVSIGSMTLGELLLVRGGVAPLLGFEKANTEPVFNIEVDADHCYRVGEQGILVHNASGVTPNPATSSTNPQTIEQIVACAGIQIGDDEVVNFGSVARTTIDPAQGPLGNMGQVRSYWFKYADIKHLTLKQVQSVIGQLAFAGNPGGANFMQISNDPISQFTLVTTTQTGIHEYTRDVAVPVRLSVQVVP